MGGTNFTAVGTNPQAQYVAFGDDCHFNDICGYAYVVVKRSRIQLATLSGHKDVKMLQRYVHLRADDLVAVL